MFVKTRIILFVATAIVAVTMYTLSILVGDVTSLGKRYFMIREEEISSISPSYHGFIRQSEVLKLKSGLMVVPAAAETHRNVTVIEATKICRQILYYGGVRVDVNTEKECIAYVLEYPSAWRELFDKIRLYVAWHNRTYHMIRKKLRMGSNIESVLGDIKTLSYWCDDHCTGYGSQFEKTFVGFFLAMLTERFFTVEWSNNFRGSDKWVEVFTPNVLNWKMDPPLSSELFKPKLCANCTHARKGDVVLYAYSTQYQHVYYDRVFIGQVLCRDHHQIGIHNMESQHVAYFCKEAKGDKYLEQQRTLHFIYGIICRLMYKFSDSVVERGEKRLREMGFLHNPFVAVHIRTALEEKNDKLIAFYSKVGRHQIDHTSWEAFIDCGQRAVKTHSIDRPLLLISDSSDCLNWTSQRYPLSRVMSSNTSFWHSSKHTTLKESEESINKILDTISDLYLISKATVVVKGISQFSKIGIYLGSISSNNVVRCDLQLGSLMQKRMKIRN